jgi:CRP-like cAMP-binding protein
VGDNTTAAVVAAPLLDALTPAARTMLLKQSIEKRYSTGDVLWSAGDSAHGIVLILEGKVRIVRVTGGRRVVIHSGDAGTTIGEVPFFLDAAYPATAVASEPTRCLLLSRAAVTEAMAVDPGLSFFLLRNLSRRVQTLVERVDRNTATSVQARLAAFMLRRSEIVGRAATSSKGNDKRRAFSLGMTQTALAEELGTVREVLARGLRALRDAGAVESVGGGKYRVADLAILEELAGTSSSGANAQEL